MIKSFAILITLLIHTTLFIKLLSKESLLAPSSSTNPILNVKLINSHNEDRDQKAPAKKIVKQKLQKRSDSSVKPQLKALTKINPHYPKLSRLFEEEGRNSIKAVINSSGIVIQTIILKSSGHTRLDDSAIKSVMETRFIPAKRDNLSIKGSKIFHFHFKLEN